MTTELADGRQKVAKETPIPLADKWQEHAIEFEINTKFTDKTTLRFRLPGNVKGTFDLTDTRLKAVQ
jgi:hypothetical protein